MRKFSSYGPIDSELHYHVPRQELIEGAIQQVKGDNPDIRYAGQLFGLELKSFANQASYQDALRQAAKYGSQLGVTEIWLVLFVEEVDDHNRERFEMIYTDKKTGIVVHPLFVQTGSLIK